MEEISITVFVDSNHGHNKVTRQSITGLIALLGRTPVSYISKRQGAIETSTYGAEFYASFHGAELGAIGQCLDGSLLLREIEQLCPTEESDQTCD